MVRNHPGSPIFKRQIVLLFQGQIMFGILYARASVALHVAPKPAKRRIFWISAEPNIA